MGVTDPPGNFVKQNCIAAGDNRFISLREIRKLFQFSAGGSLTLPYIHNWEQCGELQFEGVALRFYAWSRFVFMDTEIDKS